jgi:outer membrane protein assembly factor BamB/plastocyanin
MAERRNHAEDLSRYWDALTSGEATPDPGSLDPAEAAFILTMVSHARRARFPAGARERAREASLRQFALTHAQRSNGGTIMLSTAFPATTTRSLPRPVVTRPARSLRQPWWQRGVSLIGVAALIIAMVGGIFFTFREPSENTLPAVVASPQPAATPATAWPMWGGNPARTRDMPGPAPEDLPAARWIYPITGSSVNGPSVDGAMVADGVLYVPGGFGLTALDLASGKLLWNSSDASGIGAIDGDGIVLRSTATRGSGYDLVRIRRADGGLVWRTELGQIASNWGVVIANGVGYVPSGSDLLAFDPATGKPVWRTPLAAPASGGVSVGSGAVVVGDQKGVLYALDPSTGTIKWKTDTNATTIGQPSIAHGTISIAATGATNDYLTLDAATGAVKWRFTATSGEEFLGGAIGADAIYATNRSGKLWALDAGTGALKWSISMDANAPTLIGSTLFLTTSSGMLIAVDTGEGSKLWTFPLGESTQFTPVIVGGVIYVGTQSGKIFAIGSDLTPVANDTQFPIVALKNSSFRPSNLTVRVGTTVIWMNEGAASDTVTSDAGLFDSGVLGPGQTFSYTFTTVGVYTYASFYHPHVAGSITVH